MSCWRIGQQAHNERVAVAVLFYLRGNLIFSSHVSVKTIKELYGMMVSCF